MPINPNSPDCVREEMARWKSGKLHSGTGVKGEKGPLVKSKKQALAVALSACNQSLQSLGFSQSSALAVSELLFRSPDWNNQFTKGQTSVKLPRENKTTLAPSLPGMDVDNRPGKQKGSQGKHVEEDSSSLSPVALPKGNPQPGPRSSSDRKGLAAFGELK